MTSGRACRSVEGEYASLRRFVTTVSPPLSSYASMHFPACRGIVCVDRSFFSIPISLIDIMRGFGTSVDSTPCTRASRHSPDRHIACMIADCRGLRTSGASSMKGPRSIHWAWWLGAMISTLAGELVTMELAVVAVVVGYDLASMCRSILVASVTGTTGFHDGYGKRCPSACFYSFGDRIKPLACRRLAESSMRRGMMTPRYTPIRQVRPAIEPRSYFQERETVLSIGFFDSCVRCMHVVRVAVGHPTLFPEVGD